MLLTQSMSGVRQTRKHVYVSFCHFFVISLVMSSRFQCFLWLQTRIAVPVCDEQKRRPLWAESVGLRRASASRKVEVQYCKPL